LKGFKDKSGKFRPTENKNGVRKSRDQSAKTQGVKINSGTRMKRDSNKELEKMFAISSVVSKESMDREYDSFTSSITDYGSGDISTAVEKFKEVGLSGRELADRVREWSDETETPIGDVDVVYVAYDYILQNARNEIDSVLGFDISNDIKGGTEFYVAGNYMATSYDYSEEAVEQLRDVLKKASKSDLKKLSETIFVRSFLNDVDVFRG
jgi:hypothetical protein